MILSSGYTISSQCFRLLLEASPWLEGKGSSETFNFVLQSVGRLLKGSEHDHSLSPPPIDLLCSHIIQVGLESSFINQFRTFIVTFQELWHCSNTKFSSPKFHPRREAEIHIWATFSTLPFNSLSFASSHLPFIQSRRCRFRLLLGDSISKSHWTRKSLWCHIRGTAWTLGGRDRRR